MMSHWQHRRQRSRAADACPLYLQEGRFISISSPVGTQFSQSLVPPWQAYQQKDEVCIWLRGTSQGDYHYALNFASTFKPPVILNVVEITAISTRFLATGGRTFAERDLHTTSHRSAPTETTSLPYTAQSGLANEQVPDWDRLTSRSTPIVLEHTPLPMTPPLIGQTMKQRAGREAIQFNA